MTWRGRVALAAVLPLLAAVAAQELPGSRGVAIGVAAAPGIAHALVWGPLLETVLLLTAARLVGRVMGPAGLQRRTGAADTGRFMVSTGIVGFSFWATHAVQNGSPAWATLPMALLMAAYAARHAGDSPGKVCKVAGPMLFTMHAVYNAGILVLAADWHEPPYGSHAPRRTLNSASPIKPMPAACRALGTRP